LEKNAKINSLARKPAREVGKKGKVEKYQWSNPRVDKGQKKALGAKKDDLIRGFFERGGRARRYWVASEEPPEK